jgi:co-chaperonin GroES (HSP10)
MLQPLGHRVLIRPDQQPEDTDSGLLLPQDREYVPTVGTVERLGDGSKRDAETRKRAAAFCKALVNKFVSPDERGPIVGALDAYADRAERHEGAVSVGARVAFPDEVGSVVNVDGVRYLILPEDDIVVIELEDVPA